MVEFWVAGNKKVVASLRDSKVVEGKADYGLVVDDGKTFAEFLNANCSSAFLMTLKKGLQ